eukprot:867188-Pyramimonas_sp.AAC.1
MARRRRALGGRAGRWVGLRRSGSPPGSPTCPSFSDLRPPKCSRACSSHAAALASNCRWLFGWAAALAVSPMSMRLL